MQCFGLPNVSVRELRKICQNESQPQASPILLSLDRPIVGRPPRETTRRSAQACVAAPMLPARTSGPALASLDVRLILEPSTYLSPPRALPRVGRLLGLEPERRRLRVPRALRR